MSNQASSAGGGAPAARTIDIVNASLARRYAAEKRFRLMGMGAVVLGLAFVAILFVDIIGKGYTAFQQTYIQLPINFAAEEIDRECLRKPGIPSCADYQKLIRDSLKERFPEVQGRRDLRELYQLVSPGAPQQLRELIAAHPEKIGTVAEVWLLANDDIDMLVKGHIDRDVPESERRVKDQTLGWVDAARGRGQAGAAFQHHLLHQGGQPGARAGGHRRRPGGLLLHPAVDPAAVLSDRRGRGPVSGGVRPQEPLDRSDRGQHQQPGGGALDRVRPARARGVHQLLRRAALHAPDRRRWC